VNTTEDFIALLRDAMGLPVTDEDIGRTLDEVDGWDSVHLLSLLTLLEQRTGRTLPFAEVLEAATLRDIYTLAVAA
jgi:acyl carrier protein